MHYAYIIRSINKPEEIYIGYTNNLKKRLSDHNSGSSTYTAKYKPWILVVCVGFVTKVKALEFEQFLKTGTGRALITKKML